MLKILNKKLKKNNKGFTLVELLVVIAIIGILAAVAVPGLLKNIDKSNVAKVQSDYEAVKSAAMSVYAEKQDKKEVTQDAVKELMDKFPEETGFKAKMTLADGGVLNIKANSAKDATAIEGALGVPDEDETNTTVTIALIK